MNLLLKKPYKKYFFMQNNFNDKRSEHKKKLKEVRFSRLEIELKSNILKRKRASKKNHG